MAIVVFFSNIISTHYDTSQLYHRFIRCTYDTTAYIHNNVLTPLEEVHMVPAVAVDDEEVGTWEAMAGSLPMCGVQKYSCLVTIKGNKKLMVIQNWIFEVYWAALCAEV